MMALFQVTGCSPLVLRNCDKILVEVVVDEVHLEALDHHVCICVDDATSSDDSNSLPLEQVANEQVREGGGEVSRGLLGGGDTLHISFGFGFGFIISQ